MLILSSLKLLLDKSSKLLIAIDKEIRSLGEKCPWNSPTICSNEDIFSQCMLCSLVESILQVQGAMAFHTGQWGMTADRPSIDNRSPDILSSKLWCIISRDRFEHLTAVSSRCARTFAWGRRPREPEVDRCITRSPDALDVTGA